MSLLQVLCFTLLTVLPFPDILESERDIVTENCQEIKCSTIITDSRDGQSNGSIQVSFIDSRSLFKISIISADGKKDIDDSKSSMDSLKKGKYLVVVTGKKAESNFCPRYFELAIK